MSRRLTAQDVSVLYGSLKERPEAKALFENIIHAPYTAHLRPGDICVDGGANEGRHTIPMAHVIGHGKVYAYEPVPELAEHLFQRATQAQMQDRIEIHICALADTEGASDFVSFYHPSDMGRSSYSGLRKRRTPEDWEWQTIRTPVTTLDSSLASVSGLTFIKLDLEGGEYHALLGGERIIKSQRPVIAFEHGYDETDSLYQYSADDFWGLFKRLDYEVVDILGTEVTPELWERAVWMPWYLVAFPRELGWPESLTHAVNTVLQRYGFPRLYVPTSTHGRPQCTLYEHACPSRVHTLEQALGWKLLVGLRQIVNHLLAAIGRVG